MGNFSKFCDGGVNIDNLATIIAFDPGGTTGFCVLSIPPEALAEPGMDLNAHSFSHIEYGQIASQGNVSASAYEAETHQGHPGLNMYGENEAVKKMLAMATTIFPKAAIVFEDFIVDFKQITKARDALSPVRIISAFSYALWSDDSRLGLRNLETGRYVTRAPWIQNRALAKTTCTDTRLRHWGLYDERSGAHARDATRHAFYFMRDCEGNSLSAQEKRWRAWPHLFKDPRAFLGVENQADNRRKTKKKLGERI